MRARLLPALFLLALLLRPAAAQAQAGCSTSGSPGCGGCACEACVCQADPFCCQSAWDDLCVSGCEQCGTNCGGGNPGGCGAVTYEGCCDGEVVNWCEGGQAQKIDCSAAQSPSCGWNADAGYYDCGTAGGSDPSGANPKACGGGGNPVCGNGQCEVGESQVSCPADCGGGGPVCGNNQCEEGENATSCPQDCSTGTCGNGSCEVGENQANCPADCGGGTTCGNGTCEDAAGEDCKTCSLDCGCPDGFYCNLQGMCVDMDAPVCTPDCEGKQCGNGGCADQPGVCGSCPGFLTCADGMCKNADAGDVTTEPEQDVVTCIPDCIAKGKVCGDDGCGGSCGVCPPETPGCNEGFMCVECTGNVCYPGCAPCADGFGCNEKSWQCSMCIPGACYTGCAPCPAEFGCSQDTFTCVACEELSCLPGCPSCPAGFGCNDSYLCEEGYQEFPGAPKYQCPPGERLMYGKCVPAAAESSSDGGCSTGGGSNLSWLLLLALLALLLALAPSGAARRIGVSQTKEFRCQLANRSERM